jgi:hypothetical protein
MGRPQRAALVFAILFFACGCGDDDTAAREPPGPGPPAREAPEAPDDCDAVVSRVRDVLATLPSACSSDADCTCYPGGIEGVTGCGGVSDLPTAERIGALTQQHDRLRCDGSVSCAPRQCLVACLDGRCAERPFE